jgi:4-hydroxy-tetrahydrodipicolinate reductase
MVVGTTGFSDEQRQALATATSGVRFCQASNFAPGVNLTFKLGRGRRPRRWAISADIEIVEAHHRHKIDAPSGTALSLGEVVGQGIGP